MVAVLLAFYSALAQAQWSSTQGSFFSRGDYGRDQDTLLWSLPLSLQHRSGRWDSKLSVNYLYLHGSLLATQNKNTGQWVQGWGDSYAQTRYFFILRKGSLWWAPGFKLKMPTHQRWLGSNWWDGGVVSSLLARYGSMNLQWQLRHRWHSQIKQTELQNQWGSSMDLLYGVTRRWQTGLRYQWMQPLFTTLAPARELILVNSFNLGEAYRLSVIYGRGFSTASARWSAGAQLRVSY